MDHLLTVWSIRIAVVCLFAFLIGQAKQKKTSSVPASLTLIWMIGSACSLLHMLFAMGFVHDWSHFSAYQDTANQTEELLGARVGIGIYFNYLFVAVWLIDATWLAGWRESYWARSRWIHRVSMGYLVFIALNGAIVFEAGFIRWVTLALLAIWIYLVVRK